MSAKLVLSVLLFVLGVLTGAWLASRQVAPVDPAAWAALDARRDSLDQLARTLEQEQARLVLFGDSLKKAYKRDTLRLRSTRTVVESIPSLLEQYVAAKGVPVEVVMLWVDQYRADAKACDVVIATCEARAANAEAQQETAQAQLRVSRQATVTADSSTRVVSRQRDEARGKLARSKLETKLALVGGLLLALLAR